MCWPAWAPLGSALSSGASGSHKFQGTEIPRVFLLEAACSCPLSRNRSHRKALQTLEMPSEVRTTLAVVAAVGGGQWRSAPASCGSQAKPGLRPGTRAEATQCREPAGSWRTSGPASDFSPQTALRAVWGGLRTGLAQCPVRLYLFHPHSCPVRERQPGLQTGLPVVPGVLVWASKKQTPIWGGPT